MTDWRSIQDKAISQAGGLAAWWTAEIAGCLPSPLRDLVRPVPTRLVIEIHKLGTLKLSTTSAAGQEPLLTLRPKDGVSPQDRESLKDWAANVDSIVLCLPETCGMRRRVDLPAAARENLRDVLTMEMDRLTPFKSQEIYFAHGQTCPGKTKDQIAVELTIVPKSLADDVLNMVRGLGLAPDILTLGRDAEPERNLLPPRAGKHDSSPRAGLLGAKTVSALAAVLILAGIAIPFVKQQLALSRLSNQISAAGPAGAKAATTVRKLAAWRAGEERIAALRKSRPPVIALMDELSTSIPDGTWLTEIEVSERPGRLTISGYSNNAPALVAKLEAIDALKDVKFIEPVAYDERQSRDRFRLAASIVAPHAGGAAR